MAVSFSCRLETSLGSSCTCSCYNSTSSADDCEVQVSYGNQFKEDSEVAKMVVDPEGGKWGRLLIECVILSHETVIYSSSSNPWASLSEYTFGLYLIKCFGVCVPRRSGRHVGGLMTECMIDTPRRSGSYVWLWQELRWRPRSCSRFVHGWSCWTQIWMKL